MPFLLHEGPLWVIREALATHPVFRALQILDGLQPVQVTAATPAPSADPSPVAAEAPAAPSASAKGKKAR